MTFTHSEDIEIQKIKTLKEIDKQSALMRIMVFLKRFEHISVTLITRDLGISQQAAYRILHIFEKFEWIEKEDIGRATYFNFTEKGQQYATLYDQIYEQWKKDNNH